MGWIDEAEEAALERLMVLLVALAGLADRAAGLRGLLRLPVLLILSHAEAVARCYLLGRALDDAAFAAAASSGPGCAVSLAARFRALAALIAVFLAQHGAPSPARATGPRIVRPDAPYLSVDVRRCRVAPVAPDTS